MAIHRFDSYEFDPTGGTLIGPEGLIHLRPRTFDLLRTLVEAHPRMVSKGELLERVWKTDFISDSALTQAISELRSALGDSSNGSKYIETHHRKGYRFKAPVIRQDTGVFEDSTGPIAAQPISNHSILIGLVALVTALIVVGVSFPWQNIVLGEAAKGRPLVLLMASATPYCVFDPVTREAGGSNVDDLSKLLAELPVNSRAETTSQIWQREKQVREMDPDLIVIQYSCFFDVTDDDELALVLSKVRKAERDLESFLENMALACPSTQFLVYSRHFECDDTREQWEREMFWKFPQLEQRLSTLGIPRATASLTLPENKHSLKRLISTALDIG